MTKEIERSVEGIHQELKGSELDFYRKDDDESLKYLVRSISARLTEHLNTQERRQEDEAFDVRWSVTGIGCAGIILAIMQSASNDIEWFSQDPLALRLWAVALSTIFVGVSLERSTLARFLGHQISAFADLIRHHLLCSGKSSRLRQSGLLRRCDGYVRMARWRGARFRPEQSYSQTAR